MYKKLCFGIDYFINGDYAGEDGGNVYFYRWPDGFLAGGSVWDGADMSDAGEKVTEYRESIIWKYFCICVTIFLVEISYILIILHRQVRRGNIILLWTE